MRQLIVAVLAVFAVAAPGFSSQLVAVGQDSHLYTLIPTTGAITDLGALPTLAAGQYGDIAFDPISQNLYFVTVGPTVHSFVYKLPVANLATPGSATIVGDTTVSGLNALEVSPTGTVYAAGNTTLNGFYTINTGTGAATLVGTGSYLSTGDLEFVGGTLYLTSASPSADTLFSINTGNGSGTAIGTGIGFSNVFGLAFDDTAGVFYGVTNPGTGGGNVISINVATGAGSLVHSYPTLFNGLTDIDASVPEPGTLISSFLGVAVLGLIYRRRKSVKS